MPTTVNKINKIKNDEPAQSPSKAQSRAYPPLLSQCSRSRRGVAAAAIAHMHEEEVEEGVPPPITSLASTVEELGGGPPPPDPQPEEDRRCRSATGGGGPPPPDPQLEGDTTPVLQPDSRIRLGEARSDHHATGSGLHRLCPLDRWMGYRVHRRRRSRAALPEEEGDRAAMPEEVDEGATPPCRARRRGANIKEGRHRWGGEAGLRQAWSGSGEPRSGSGRGRRRGRGGAHARSGRKGRGGLRSAAASVEEKKT